MLKSIELSGFKSFGKKSELQFTSPIAAIVGPNGSGKSNVAEAFRFVLGEQSMKSLRSKKGEDLIWGGSPGLGRSNRAAVKVTFDNEAHALPVDFPEVIIERVVYRDGVNEYSINGSKVRLRDITALLAQANIGSSGYHIISQGEADRVLSASPRERREMVEEALGLKAYQNKKVESEKKLEETDQNLHEVSLLRRELAPHIKYLSKQVEKIEQAQTLATDLAVKLSDYLARERAYLVHEKTRLGDELKVLMHERGEVGQRIETARAAMQVLHENDAHDELHAVEEKLAHARSAREDASRALGRAEGQLSALSSALPDTAAESVSSRDVVHFIEQVTQAIDSALGSSDTETIHTALRSAQGHIAQFRTTVLEAGSGTGNAALAEATERVAALSSAFESAQRAVEAVERELADQRTQSESEREAHHRAERTLIEAQGQLRTTLARIAQVEGDLQELERLQTRFDEEVREGVLLVGRAFSIDASGAPADALSEDRSAQETRRREIERLKIKIEEYRGAGADDVLREYQETQERDAFLAREMEDLERSAAQLREIIAQLDANIESRFAEGLSRITTEFNTFFVQLFGGGSATLTLEKAKEQTEGEEAQPAGLAVAVQLPRKQARGLEVLSGGERALTSIALIFAMSQVNPPPFLILDETDAALDEANSRRYAQIVEMLAKRSQLILITHNRATMAAAGELYGVTMGGDGVSKLLSVKLEEAQAVAK